jgi:signal transduction histidine kinase/ActR/RegA family two-component response regulator
MNAAWLLQCGALRQIARLLRVPAALTLLVMAGLCAQAAQATLSLDHASFLHEGDAPRDLALPHTWALDGLPASGRARYRFEFDLDQAPTRPWALAAERMGSRHALWLNGSLIHGGLDAAAQVRGVPAPALIDLPPALMRAGTNRIEVDVDFDFRAGMSPLHVGPADLVQPSHVQATTWIVTVPQTMNAVATGLALFMLTIWLRRRAEHELGYFCGLMVTISLRNVLSTGSGNQWHTVAADYLLYALQVLSVVLLAHFALAFAKRDSRVLRRVVDGAAVLFIVGGAVAAWNGAMTPLRLYAYPLLILLLVPSLWLLFVGARQARGARQAALTLAVGLLAGAAVHDYFFLRGVLSVMDHYWMPYTSPLALLIFAWVQLDRMAGALTTVENLAAQLEQRVAERTRELQLANDSKTRFLAAASHDLRQPVVSIGLLTDLLRDQPASPGAHALLDRIGDSVQAMNSLLKGLLDLSRFDAGAVEVRLARVALKPLLESVLGDEREAARRKGIALRLRAPAFLVQSDAVLLEQIVRNLVGNAVRYTERGGVLVSARRRTGDRVLVQVWDSGVGIPAASHALVFEEFVQLDNDARERMRGLGLGLSLVKRAAAMLQAPLALRSQPGRGSCFSVELPFVGIEAARVPGAPATGLQLDGMRLWVVEDDPDVREALRLRLSRWGAQVQAFAGALAAGHAIDGDDAPPDLLVTDQRLPDGSGLAVVQRLRERFGRVPALVITGDTSPADVARLRASGVPVLHKPFASGDLLAAVRTLAQAPGVRA